jgi:NNP family nitrate/nitrite transporter-like MFS transporter
MPRSHRINNWNHDARSTGADGHTMSSTLIGFAGAVSALGGLGINLALRQSDLANGAATSAFWIFVPFYVTASILTWTMYARRTVPVCVSSETTRRQRVSLNPDR